MQGRDDVAGYRLLPPWVSLCRVHMSRLWNDLHRTFRTYLISGSIIDFFYTQIIGDPTDRPVIKAAANFPTNTTLGLLDGNQVCPSLNGDGFIEAPP